MRLMTPGRGYPEGRSGTCPTYGLLKNSWVGAPDLAAIMSG
jgi:hypothetical protein